MSKLKVRWVDVGSRIDGRKARERFFVVSGDGIDGDVRLYPIDLAKVLNKLKRLDARTFAAVAGSINERRQKHIERHREQVDAVIRSMTLEG